MARHAFPNYGGSRRRERGGLDRIKTYGSARSWMTPGAVTTFNALVDHALWFHRPVDLSDWVLFDQFSPSGIAGRGLTTSTMYNRAGQLVCIATKELYLGRGTT